MQDNYTSFGRDLQHDGTDAPIGVRLRYGAVERGPSRSEPGAAARVVPWRPIAERIAFAEEAAKQAKARAAGAEVHL